MKTTTLFSSLTAATLTAFIASLLFAQDTMTSCALFAAVMTALITAREYMPRSYFSITSAQLAPKAAYARMPGALNTSRQDRIRRAARAAV